MLSRTDIERLAAMAHALRNDWPIPSLCTWLMKDHTSRAYRDVAVALAYVASDPATKTPKRMNELGPWWSASVSGPASQPIHFDRCPEPGHTSYPAHNCGACRTEALEGTHEPVVDVTRAEIYSEGAEAARAALEEARKL